MLLAVIMCCVSLISGCNNSDRCVALWTTTSTPSDEDRPSRRTMCPSSVEWSACRLKPAGRPQHKAPPSPPPRHIASGSNIGERQCDRRSLDSRVVFMASAQVHGPHDDLPQ